MAFLFGPESGGQDFRTGEGKGRNSGGTDLAIGKQGRVY